MLGGAVRARSDVSISAKAYSFHEKINENTVVAAMPGDRLRQHDLAERLQAGVAIDQRRFFIFARDFVDEALEQPHRERQIEAGIEQNHAEMGVVQPKLAVHQEDRYGHDHSGQHTLAEDEKQQIVLAGDIEAAEGIGRQYREHHREESSMRRQ